MNGRRERGRNFNGAQPWVANRSVDHDCRGDVKCHYLAEFRETLQHHQAFGRDGPNVSWGDDRGVRGRPLDPDHRARPDRTLAERR